MISSVIKIKDEEFLELRDIIYKYSSILFADSKKYLIENRLSRHLSDLNFISFKDYIYYLKYDVNKQKEINTLINLVTINETFFLREKAQIVHMVSNFIPDMLKKGKSYIRIWSAACSTGEEPYSIAILLKEAGLFNKAKIDIVGMDINSDVIEFAKAGEYRSTSFRGAPDDFKSKYFKQNGLIYNLDEDIKSRVRFLVGSLTSPNVSMQVGKFDVIFCRNVLIYFDADGKSKVINMFYNVLNKPGALYLGHSESLSGLSDKFNSSNFGTGVINLKV